MRSLGVHVADIEQLTHRQFALNTQQELLGILKRQLRSIVGSLFEVELIRGQGCHRWKDNGPRRRPSLQLECSAVAAACREYGTMRGEPQPQRCREIVVGVVLGASRGLEDA